MTATPMQFKRLLAKRSASPDVPSMRETLPGHLLDVIQTAQAIVDCSGHRALESLGLPESLAQDLADAVIRGAFLHDLGKASHQFQRMVWGSRKKQALRHEWISVWLVFRHAEMDRWLFEGCSEAVRYAALFAALGHHLKAEDGSNISPRDGSGDNRVVVLCGHEDFRSCLDLAREKLNTSAPPTFNEIGIDLLARPLAELRSWLLEASDWHGKADGSTRRFVALVKAMVIAADVAGSVVPKHGRKPEQWANEVIRRTCTGEDLERIALSNLKGHPRRAFQEKLGAAREGVTFVKAGCGSGKTVGAYLWASRHARGRKLFVCYPTTGTSTEGFRDYVIPGEMAADAALIHSRSEVDLEAFHETGEDESTDGRTEPTTKIEALEAWDVPVVICTADLVLGIIQNNRRALFSFPSIVNGAFVFDEIHQYDDRLFGALLCFLETFQGAPTLLMTASLPLARLKAIQERLGRIGTSLRMIQGPPDLEGVERYELSGPVDAPPWHTIEKMLGEGGKVLWVANTVGHAVKFAKEAQERGLSPLPYHARYRYLDRLGKHSAVIAAFKAPGPALAVTTQVCEVSLDLSADLLVSDLAPIPALIQRLGRLNRRASPDCPSDPRQAIFLEPGILFPYDKEEFDPSVVRKWLAELANRPVSQTDLAEAFLRYSNDYQVSDVGSAWLHGGPFSKPAHLREDGATVAVIRSEDERACMNGKGKLDARTIVKHSIPMTLGPVAKEIGGWRRLGSVFAAPPGRIDYSDMWGARWAKG